MSYFLKKSNKSPDVVKSKKKKSFRKFLNIFFLFVFFLLLFTSKWYQANFKGNTIDSVIFTLKAPIKGTNSDVLVSYALDVILLSLILSALVFILSILVPKVTMHIRNRCIRLYPQTLLILLVLIGLARYPIATISDLKVIDYIHSKMMEPTTLFEDHYVSPERALLKFPQTKRNLIYIILESMESTYSSTQYGGVKQKNLIPSLTSIALNNTSFSKGSDLTGVQEIFGTGWTIASLVAQTSGVPLVLPIDGNSYSRHSQFMPGIVALGDILHEQGYHQVFMIGSDGDFGGRKDYLQLHGNYEILDYNYAIDTHMIPEGYKVWWGYEDAKLYEFAKEELLHLSSQEKPFNFTMLTVDTHHVSGYVCDLCSNEYEEQYSNVIACADRQVGQFVEWLSQQPFYENTTIIIVGDHLSMDPAYFHDVPESYQRTMYNAIINPLAHAVKKDHRAFSMLDMFPTTLAALGVEIEGERLGLGTNLFSNQSTLLEKYGFEYVNEELRKNSAFYNEFFIQ
ncbi:MAG: LTA synthase family protein [Christensenellales bacterium]|jgi:phosphoglycerol transferase